MVTNTSAAVGGITWLLLDYWQERKWSPVGFCSGAIAGLVGVTPASGYIGTPASVAIGVITAVICNYSTKLKILCRYDDALGESAHLVRSFLRDIHLITEPLPHVVTPRYLCFSWYRRLCRLNIDGYICRQSRRCIRRNNCDTRWMDQSSLHANPLSTRKFLCHYGLRPCGNHDHPNCYGLHPRAFPTGYTRG